MSPGFSARSRLTLSLALPLFLAAFLSSLNGPRTRAQAPAAATATLHEIRAEGLKSLTLDQVAAMSQLQKDAQVSKADLQAAADRLLQTGMFAKVNFQFQTKDQAVTLTFQLEESPRVPIYFDNFAWFPDSELLDAIHKKLPFVDNALPEGGAVIDQATDALNELLAAHNIKTTIEHQLLANPIGDGNVQEFRVQDCPFRIAAVTFSDPAIGSSRAVQQGLEAVQGKPFSRMTIDLFLSEQLRPFYLEKGFLRAKLGPPEVRLPGEPNRKLPEQLPVFVPISAGPAYHWKDVQWSGNSVLSTITLTNALGLKTGDLADGTKIEAAWDHIREEYGRLGYLDAKLDPVVAYDDQAHTVSYNVAVAEGVQYHYNAMVVTGLSTTAEGRLKQVWPIEANAVFDKGAFEKFLIKLQTHPAEVFGDLPLHYDTVGHWLRTDPDKRLVDVLLDFR
jgi:outer membrane protein insertion porin family